MEGNEADKRSADERRANLRAHKIPWGSDVGPTSVGAAASVSFPFTGKRSWQQAELLRVYPPGLTKCQLTQFDAGSTPFIMGNQACPADAFNDAAATDTALVVDPIAREGKYNLKFGNRATVAQEVEPILFCECATA